MLNFNLNWKKSVICSKAEAAAVSRTTTTATANEMLKFIIIILFSPDANY